MTISSLTAAKESGGLWATGTQRPQPYVWDEWQNKHVNLTKVWVSTELCLIGIPVKQSLDSLSCSSWCSRSHENEVQGCSSWIIWESWSHSSGIFSTDLCSHCSDHVAHWWGSVAVCRLKLPNFNLRRGITWEKEGLGVFVLSWHLTTLK